MIESATGLVLRIRSLTETSLIVHWLTPGLGRLATVAKGARRPKSPFRGKLDLFYLADFSFLRSRRSELHTLREAVVRESHAFLRRDLVSLEQASYAAALTEQTTETETPLPGIFSLVTSFLTHLGEQPAQAQSVLGFELKLLEELGMQPDLERTRLNPGTRQVATALREGGWPPAARLSEPQLTELSEFLHGFLIYHLGKIPKGRASALRRASAPVSLTA